MNQGHISQVIGSENAKLLDKFMVASGVPLMVLITPHEAAVAQSEDAQVDYVAFAGVLRDLADQAEALGSSQPMVLH